MSDFFIDADRAADKSLHSSDRPTPVVHTLHSHAGWDDPPDGGYGWETIPGGSFVTLHEGDTVRWVGAPPHMLLQIRRKAKP